ncbi:MAG: histidine--tRNA ligase [Enterobacteriaceae bacterium]
MRIFKSIKGMHDILDEDIIIYRKIENIFRNIVSGYGYKEIRTPILERTELFEKSIGISTEILSKEMYRFIDHGEKVSLRPEGTMSCIRFLIEKKLLRLNKEQRFWYVGAMFRRNKPQKGRYRQFYQIGIELLGNSSIETNLEIILMVERYFKKLNINKYIFLEINCIGSFEDREIYKKKLLNFLIKNKKKFNKLEINSFTKNPLRLLDSKNSKIQEKIKKAPNIKEYISKKSFFIFNYICRKLKDMKILYKINRRLVRGIDYYDNFVFEWKTKMLGSQCSVGGGGRYDFLIKKLNNNFVPAIGFALGVDRLALLIKKLNYSFYINNNKLDIYFISLFKEINILSLKISEEIRNKFPNIKLIIDYSNRKLKKTIKKALKLNSKLVLILGKKELIKKTIIIKFLDKNKQIAIYQKDLILKLSNFLKKNENSFNNR